MKHGKRDRHGQSVQSQRDISGCSNRNAAVDDKAVRPPEAFESSSGGGDNSITAVPVVLKHTQVNLMKRVRKRMPTTRSTRVCEWRAEGAWIKADLEPPHALARVNAKGFDIDGFALDERALQQRL